jgi:hypothetical protein
MQRYSDEELSVFLRDIESDYTEREFFIADLSRASACLRGDHVRAGGGLV